MRLIESHDDLLDEAAALRAMFIARKEVFVDLLGWDVPVLEGRYELDHFDDVHARYLILLDNDGRHRASTRLLPTTRPHILEDLFPDLCAGDVPRGERIYEITRFCLDRHQAASERRTARNRLITGLADFALANGIATYTGVAELSWLKQIRDFGWKCSALGGTRDDGARALTAFRIDIDANTIAGLTAAGIYDPCAADSLRPLVSEAA